MVGWPRCGWQGFGPFPGSHVRAQAVWSGGLLALFGGGAAGVWRRVWREGRATACGGLGGAAFGGFPGAHGGYGAVNGLTGFM